jgi:hypothetical protein
MKKNDGSKTSAIRSLVDANPDISAADAVATLKKQGITIHKQTFYAVKSIYKKGKSQAVPQIKKGRKKVKAKIALITDPMLEIEILKRENRKFKDIMMRLLLD